MAAPVYQTGPAPVEPIKTVAENANNYYLNLSNYYNYITNFAFSPTLSSDFSNLIAYVFRRSFAIAKRTQGKVCFTKKESVQTTRTLVGYDSPNTVGSICRICCQHSMYNRLGESAN